ncbi:E3 ubiquitin-protein ligase TRIM39-like [Chanos chanos]|uniref:E3 ubiquitin-protein ligase TRIM39-like n=1 Tax=Chanos chanos TaxID=29144 RepID=A0A6J2VN69_CHACN|nr:E3 ubiquitin-protein ligase TRIM39-like [Chanos chanos]
MFLLTNMASSSSLLSEDQFLCSVCLDVFTDPVSTPCGHNFCMTCLKEFWDSSEHCLCALCKRQFPERPELYVNTFISGLVSEFKKTVQLKVSGPKERLADKPGEVSCDVCTGQKLKAVKSCLDCGLSYCETHLEPHKTAAKLKKHKLMDPVENLEDYIYHKTHNTVPLKEESEERKSQLGKTQTEVQHMIQDKLKKIKEIRHSVELSKTNTERQIADSVEVFSSLIGCIERSQAELIELMKEKQKAAERQAEGLIKELEQEVTELKRRDTELEQLSHSEDHLHLLQVYPTLCSPPHTTHSTDISIDPHLCVDTLRKTLEQLEKKFHEEVGRECEKEIESRKRLHAEFSKLSTVDVTLDPDTANPYLILSDDGKQVTCGDTRQNLPDNPERFDLFVFVLGKEGFSSGRFYYEVEVRGKTKWTLGVVRESINRKGDITVSPEDGYWTISLRNGDEYKALDSPSVLLSLRQKPQKVGVFVDYEEGLVSFYDVEASSHIYSFTGQSFTDKLYPLFNPCFNDEGKNSSPLIITLVR